jgi:hypothetical protein
MVYLYTCDRPFESTQMRIVFKGQQRTAYFYDFFEFSGPHVAEQSQVSSEKMVWRDKNSGKSSVETIMPIDLKFYMNGESAIYICQLSMPIRHRFTLYVQPQESSRLSWSTMDESLTS